MRCRYSLEWSHFCLGSRKYNMNRSIGKKPTEVCYRRICIIGTIKNPNNTDDVSINGTSPPRRNHRKGGAIRTKRRREKSVDNRLDAAPDPSRMSRGPEEKSMIVTTTITTMTMMTTTTAGR